MDMPNATVPLKMVIFMLHIFYHNKKNVDTYYQVIILQKMSSLSALAQVITNLYS